MSRRLIGLLAGVLLGASSSSVHAGLIQWDYEATISAISGDPLGIDGESVTMSLTFDDTNVWTALKTFPSATADATISGPHTIALNTVAPAARHFSTGGQISQELDSPNFVDFIIDGVLTDMGNFLGDTALVPSVGDNLLIGHLPSEINNASFLLPDSTSADYALIDSVVSTSSVSVPEPTTIALLSFGLAGLGFTRRRIKA